MWSEGHDALGIRSPGKVLYQVQKLAAANLGCRPPHVAARASSLGRWTRCCGFAFAWRLDRPCDYTTTTAVPYCNVIKRATVLLSRRALELLNCPRSI